MTTTKEARDLSGRDIDKVATAIGRWSRFNTFPEREMSGVIRMITHKGDGTTNVRFRYGTDVNLDGTTLVTLED